MGGGGFYYETERRSSSFTEANQAVRQATSRSRAVHDLLNPKDRSLHCADTTGCDSTPVVIAFDVTRSRGDDVEIIYQKLPMLIGEMIGKDYLEHPAISFCAIGDATSGDMAPLQVGNFANDNKIDDILAAIWLEKGGGGTGQESYELAAYHYGTKSKLDSLDKRGEKGFFFFIGDEGFYPQVNRSQIKNVLGEDVPADISSEEAFRLLQEKYEVFYIYPKQGWRERKNDIDAEIKARVTAAGGQYDNVDLRCSLLWNTRSDLDIHCQSPDGHIYFSDKKKGSGWLDIDMNVHGETEKPVENIRWPYGKCKRGHYKFFVHNYTDRHHSDNPFTVELENNGQITRIQETAKGTDDTITVFEIDYNPDERPAKLELEMYAGYEDETIKSQWASVIPEENILVIEDPKAVADVILGALALASGVDLDTYTVHLEGRGQTLLRQQQVAGALEGLSGTKAITTINNLPSGKPPAKRGGKTEKL